MFSEWSPKQMVKREILGPDLCLVEEDQLWALVLKDSTLSFFFLF